MITGDNTDKLAHWAGPAGSAANVKANHKWIAKVDMPDYTRYFFDADEYRAYLREHNLPENTSENVINRAEENIDKLEANSTSNSSTSGLILAKKPNFVNLYL